MENKEILQEILKELKEINSKMKINKLNEPTDDLLSSENI